MTVSHHSIKDRPSVQIEKAVNMLMDLNCIKNEGHFDRLESDKPEDIVVIDAFLDRAFRNHRYILRSCG